MENVNVTVNGACCQYDGKKIMTNPALSAKAKVGKMQAKINNREQTNRVR